MLAPFPAPVLSVAADAVKDLEGGEALSGLWTLFTKCKGSLQDGHRLENISWRLWYRELAQQSYDPLTPESLPFISSQAHGSNGRNGYFTQGEDPIRSISPGLNQILSPATTSTGHHQDCFSDLSPLSPSFSGNSAHYGSPVCRARNPSVGRIIVDMLPNSVVRPGKIAKGVERGERRKVAKKDDEKMSETGKGQRPSPPLLSPQPNLPHPTDALPFVQLPSTPPSTRGSFPRLVIVNPTPHPTPPATPVLSHASATPASPSRSAARQPFGHFLHPGPTPHGGLNGCEKKETKASSSKQAASGAPQPSDSRLPASQASHLPVPLPSHLVSQPSRSSKPLAPNPSKKADEPTKPSIDRMFFLQQSPDADSPPPRSESAEGDKGASDRFEGSSGSIESRLEQTNASSHIYMKSSNNANANTNGHTNAHVNNVNLTMTTANANANAKATMDIDRQQQKARKGKLPVRPAARRTHSARYVVPVIQRRASGVESKHKATLSMESAGLSKERESVDGQSPHAVFKGLSKESTEVVEAKVAPAPKRSSVSSLPKTTRSSPPPPPTMRSGRTVMVASTSSEYETEDSDEDDEAWASEELSPQEIAKQKEAIRLREAAEEAQRQRDMFKKIPRTSYANLQRTQSGLLSQLLNPDPNVLPLGHAFRSSASTQDMARFGNTNHSLSPPMPMLQTSKSTAALPLAAAVTALAPSSNGASGVGAGFLDREKQVRGGGYRPKGRPQSEELEDESESEGDNTDDKIQVSRSVAQQKLEALAGRRKARTPNVDANPSPNPRPPHHSRSETRIAPEPVLLGPTPAIIERTQTMPIPVSHPYNLPAPAPPTSPRTTRRHMLATELSESLRRNLLWERQIMRTTTSTARRPGLLGGLQPLTSTATAGSSPTGRRPSASSGQDADDKDERRRKMVARNRSWADDYHFSGW